MQRLRMLCRNAISIWLLLMLGSLPGCQSQSLEPLPPPQSTTAPSTTAPSTTAPVVPTPDTLSPDEISLVEPSLVELSGSVQQDPQLAAKPSRLLPGVEFWPYPKSYKFGRVQHHSPWLVVGLSTGAAVVDLRKRPPRITYWNCGVMRAIEPAPKGEGWFAITRTGSTADDILFPLWRHLGERPGDSKIKASDAAPKQDHLRGLAIIDNQALAFNKRNLFRFKNGKLTAIQGLPQATGDLNVLGTREFAHGVIHQTNQRWLLWDGDAFALEDGSFVKKLELNVKDSYEFFSVPAGNDGFYFLADRKLTHVSASLKQRAVMTGVENVMGIEQGPEGSIVFSLGENEGEFSGGIWFPSQDRYITLSASQLKTELTAASLHTFHFSPPTNCFVFVASGGVYTIPAKSVMSLERFARQASAVR